MHNKSLDARRNSDFVIAARVRIELSRRRFRPRQFNRYIARGGFNIRFMTNRLNLSFSITLLLIAGTANFVSAQDCPIRQTVAVKIMQTIGVKNPNKSGSSSVFGVQNCNEALEVFVKEVSLRREAKDIFGEAWVLTQIGDIYWELKKYQEASDYYVQALSLFRQMKNIDGESELLSYLASINESLKNYSQALKYLDEELLIVRVSENKFVRSDEGRILDRKANIYLESGEDAKAFECFNERLAFERERNSEVGESFAFKAFGKAYEEKGKKGEALESYQKALDLYLKFSRGWQGDIVTDGLKELRDSIERLQK